MTNNLQPRAQIHQFKLSNIIKHFTAEDNWEKTLQKSLKM